MLFYGLDNIVNLSTECVGAKALNLAQSRAFLRGFPDVCFAKSMVVSSDFFSSCLMDCSDPCGKYDELVSRIEDYFGDVPLIVRSSSSLEDSKFFSGAGQYDSFMNIRGRKAIVSAIKKVEESISSSNADMYIELNEDDKKKGTMAVLIQEMVKVNSAGVLYTKDPLKAKCGIVIEGAKNSGDKVASGEIRSVSYYSSEAMLEYPENCIVPRTVFERLVEISMILEKGFDCPLDVEWGVCDNKIYIFQARPMFFAKVSPYYEESTQIIGRDSNLGQSISTGIVIGKIDDKRILFNHKFVLADQMPQIVAADAIVPSTGLSAERESEFLLRQTELKELEPLFCIMKMLLA